jgi:hypothetical protein
VRIVELFGPPGVGKSTLAATVQHQPSGVPASASLPTGLFRAAYRVLVAHVTDRLRHRLPRTGRLLAGLETITRQQGGARWLIEEGCAQRAALLALIAVPRTTMAAYLAALPVHPLTVVLCEATPPVIVRRGLMRGRPGLTLPHAVLASTACTWAAHILAARGVTIHRLDMERPIVENAARLTGWLR